MRIGVNSFVVLGMVAALQLLSLNAHAELDVEGPPSAADDAPPSTADDAPPSTADDAPPSTADDAPPKSTDQTAEDRWIPSLAIIGGANFQTQKGRVDSVLFENMAPPPVELQPSASGDDFVVGPFVGAALEILAPALPVKTSPRFFVSGEILPTFASERNLALQGEPDCIRGPEPGAPCALDEPPGARQLAFSEDVANGQGSRTTSEIDTVVFGANLGVAFPIQAGKYHLRIKPSVAWINYKVDASGVVVDAACAPPSVCTDVYAAGNPIPVLDGFLRQTTLKGSDSQRFNGIGGGLDVEVDTGRFGPIGSSLFLGARFYGVVGDRTMRFEDSQDFDDLVGMDTAAASWEVEVKSILYRAHVGLRLHWLGSGN